MKNKKRNSIIAIIVLILIFLVGSVVFFLTYSSDDSSFSILEKKWITDQMNQMVDVDVYNDVPVYGYNGSGIIFDFLTYFTKNYQVNFNKISYYTTSEWESNGVSFQVLDTNEKLGSQDLLMYQDHYVVLASGLATHISFSELENIGCLDADKEVMVSYFGEKVEIVSYNDIDALVSAILNKEVSYVILPNMQFMYDILKNDLSIVYHLSDLKNSFVLRVEDATTYQVLKKGYLEYLDTEYLDNYRVNYLNVYFDGMDTTDLLRKNYTAKSYKYGYAVNMPYENDVNGQFVGTISNYIRGFEEITGAEIEMVRYQSIDEVKSALVSGEIDFAMANFDYEHINMDSVLANTIDDLDYVVLAKQDISMNSVKGLMGYKVSVVLSSKLYQLAKDSGLKMNLYPNTDALLRSLDDQSIALMDKETYRYYKDDMLADYKVIYEDSIEDGYCFIMNAKNVPFTDLFDYYVSTIDYHDFRYLYHTDITLTKDYTSFKILGFIVALVLFLISTIIFMNRKNVTNTVISKEEKLKYIDPMTSLKNRSYLNMNIYNWDNNVIFPQSVVVFDVNKLKEVNDRLGREAGDEIINKIASILINHQLENTDIIRSGGDEFLVYMVGYEEKDVSEYTKKMLKEMKNIPHSMGVEVGYSMILDEVKTVDDAINEAILMMTKNKEKRK